MRFEKNRVGHLGFSSGGVFGRPDNLQTRILLHFRDISKLTSKSLKKDWLDSTFNKLIMYKIVVDISRKGLQRLVLATFLFAQLCFLRPQTTLLSYLWIKFMLGSF